MIKVSINVDRIDKGKFFKGKKGRYLDLVLIETPDNKYGHDYLVKQGQTKEARDSGEKTPILGNAKIVQSKGNNATSTKQEGGEQDDW